MKKSAVSILIIAISLFSGGAFAQSQPGGCKLFFHVHIDSIVLFSHGSGHGFVACSSSDGTSVAKSKVDIAISGIGLGLGTFDIKGVSGSIGIDDPTELAGTYAVAEANVGLGAAVGASLGFESQDTGLSFTGNVDAGTGIGAFLNGTSWTITLAQ